MQHYLSYCLLFVLLFSACSTPQVKPYETIKTNEVNWDRYYPTDLQLVIDEQSKVITHPINGWLDGLEPSQRRPFSLY